MKCPQCQFENPEQMKFCGECGVKLEQVCPKCEFANPFKFKFCGECGHNLSQPLAFPPRELSFNEKLEKIQRYLPEGLTEKILTQKERIEGERRQVTVMFCDMEGFTTLVERLGPEAAYSIMDEVYEVLIHKVHDYEGTVNEMTGDGIMALFGAPIALEDAPQRAIRSAYAIHREMTTFSDSLQKERGGTATIKMRIGIHTGPVVVGTLGNDLRVEFKAVGDTVNIASRMESLAEPGSTYVTEEIFKLTEGLFRFEALGEHAVKGKAGAVKTYQVIAPSTRRTRFDVSTERGLTPFIGRERELELLLEGFAWAKSGKGQVYSIIAEAGVGKSRLLYEFRKAVANEDRTFLEGKCLSYCRGVAFHPIIDILKSNFNIHEGAGDFEIKEKVKEGVKILGTDEHSTLPYFLELLSVKDSGIDKIPISPEAKKHRLIQAINHSIIKGSEIRPLVIAFEDLHWVDKGSEDVFKYLLASIPGARVLLIFTYRPNFVPTWGGKSYHSQINLNRLSNRESLIMVAHQLNTKEIDRNLEDLILEKTEGIPFFIEEFVKSLKDLGIIERRDYTYHFAKEIQNITIPSTLQDVIMARVDSLPEGPKEVLQTCSVIEREFSHELINRVTNLKEKELLTCLSVLKDSELLYERGIYPDATYVFKHALTREVVYNSIMTKRRKKLHEKIGNAIEELYKDNIDEHYGVLTEHFIVSENHEKGYKYCKLAGKKAEKAASFTDAIEYTRKRIVCLEKLPLKEDVLKRIIDARSSLGLYMFQMYYFVEAKEAIEPIIDLAIKSGYKKKLSQIYTIMGTYNYWVEEDAPTALKYLEDAFQISEELNDVVSLFFSSGWLGLALSNNCEFEKGLYYLEKTVDINVAANNLWGISTMKSCVSLYSYYLSGKIDLGYQTSYDATQLAEESGDIFSKAIAYISHGISCYGKGFFEEAAECILKGADFCKKINLLQWNGIAQFNLGEIFFDIGEYKKSDEHYGKAVWLFGQNRSSPSTANLAKLGLVRTKVKKAEKDVNLESIYGNEYESNYKIHEGWKARYLSEILLHINDQHLFYSEEWIKKAIEADNRNGMMFHLGKNYALYSDLFKRKGDLSRARENLTKAIEIFKECGADGWVEKYEKELV
ncbi:MAG: AAA family ATPase [Desulfobacteraceae bacterium]|nr:AAA family ATPase [Desulfobacteraceae bacterium]MDH3722710.1 AAA family ATPase [Desulfobacteraceae bacterium]MDH3836871.1 AAA family ATPase [Desulfobacteraceae bacterium]MDH3875185.1 AAA family ATPase [Desulfobacteraceae bacterium]